MIYECGLICDLLPLYHENLASEASRKAVEEHLPECDKCSAELEDLQKPQGSLPAAALPLEHISRGIRTKRRLSVLLAACLLLALAVAFGAFVSDKEIIGWRSDLLSFSQQEGLVLMKIGRPGLYADVAVARQENPDRPGTRQYEVSLFSRRFDFGAAQGQVPLEVPEGKEISVYYVKADEPSVLVYGKDLYPDGGYMVLPRLALAYYVLLAAALAVLLALLLLLFRRHAGISSMLKALLGLPLSYLVGQLLVKGFSTLSPVSLLRDFQWILACAAFLHAAWLVFLRLRRARQPETSSIE